MRVTVIGAGVAGLVTATELQGRGFEVTVLERGTEIGQRACSWFAGGMLAPWCERESADEAVIPRGQASLSWWPQHNPGTVQRGTLVVAPARDMADLHRFARRTRGFLQVDGDAIAALEPDLGGRFRAGLFFPEEAHLDPREALVALAGRVRAGGGVIRFGADAVPEDIDSDHVIDCRGYGGRDRLPALRGVRGEMAIVRAPEVRFSRPIRLLHPRIPLYVVPRTGGRFMIGATMIESDHRGPMTVRSAIELLSAAFTLHPSFAEAEILEFGADVRPSYPDNLPVVETRGRITSLNGLFRHGFLLSPSFAQEIAAKLIRQGQLVA